MNQQISSIDELTPKKATAISSSINPWMVRFAYPLGCHFILPLYFGRITITGQENIPTTNPVIVAPTHRSRWDALLVPYAVGRLASGRDLRFMVMTKEMQGFQGWIIRQFGGFPVNTERPGAGSLLHSVELLSQGEMVVIFPEGGIFRERDVQRLKPGVARIALEVETNHPGSGIKILPMSIQYTHSFPRWGTDVTINIGKPIEVDKYDRNNLKENTRQLTAELKTALKELQEEKEFVKEIILV